MRWDRKRPSFDGRFRNIDAMQQMWLECIEALVVDEPLQDRQRQTLRGVVEVMAGRMPAAFGGDPARATERLLLGLAEFAQDYSWTCPVSVDG
jgi:hypothetical protein